MVPVGARYEKMFFNKMNKIQTEIADAILQYTYNNGRGSYLGVKDYLYFRVGKPLYSLKDINIVLGVLLGSKLLKGDAKMFFLTEEGEKAMRLGLNSYENFLSETEIKREKNDFKREIIIGIIGAIVGSIISFLLSWML